MPGPYHPGQYICVADIPVTDRNLPARLQTCIADQHTCQVVQDTVKLRQCSGQRSCTLFVLMQCQLNVTAVKRTLASVVN